MLEDNPAEEGVMIEHTLERVTRRLERAGWGESVLEGR